MVTMKTCVLGREVEPYEYCRMGGDLEELDVMYSWEEVGTSRLRKRAEGWGKATP